MVEKPFAISIDKVVASLDSHAELGLDREVIQERMNQYGPNQIPQYAPKKRWRILTDQLLNPILYILFAASILAFIFNDILEGIAILIVILISAGIGFFMELQAVRSLEELRKMGQSKIFVIRSGKSIQIKSFEVVPGDIVLLRTGDIVSADARLMAVDNLLVKESALTGESVPVTKQTRTLPHHSPITDQHNMVFRGTMVTAGSGKAIVTATAKHTQLGHIQQLGIDAIEERTPLEKKLNQLSRWLIWLTLFFAIFVIIVGYIRGNDFLLMVETGVALAVAAIPEGLPIVATIALAQGMLRLSKRQVIIKELEAVQTLGATDIICTDKTGTLTEDRMKVHAILYGDESVDDAYSIEVSSSVKEHPVFNKMMLAGVLCNNEDPNAIKGQGDSIELSLMEFAKYLGYDPVSIKENNPELLELPFDATRKFMATAHSQGQRVHVYAKGAFESLIIHCDFIMNATGIISFDTKSEWHAKVNTLADQGLRTLAFAYKETQELPTSKSIIEGLTFLGIIGFLDPARNDVKATIDIYKKAGIKVVMVTGDHPGTSKKIAQEVGLLEMDASLDKVMIAKDFVIGDNPDATVIKRLLNASVFARVTPEQKLDIVKFYQKNNHIVGMIGDGINDVPALKKADIGIAMGIRGTEAAREAADVILKNDGFTAIELAIRQGRVIFENIRQFVVYLLSCNLAEILSVGIAASLNFPSPLLPMQILFLNLITDVFPALALGLGKGEKDIMERPPNNPKAPIINRKDWYNIILYGLCISLAVLGIVAYAYLVLELPTETINNMAFYTLVMAQLFNVFNLPKHTESFCINEVTTNIWVWGAIVLSLGITFGAYLITPVAEALSLDPVSMHQLILVVLFALGSLVLAQLTKRSIKYCFGKTPNG